jgi:chromate reductase
MKILVFVGSLRGASYSLKLARAAEKAAPGGTHFEYTDGRALPLFDQDLEEPDKPEPVRALVDKIEAADALLFVSPEYNTGIPGPLKNAIDWASRPPYRSPLKDKPSLILTCSPSPIGGARAHTQLSAVLGGTLTPLLVAPGFSVPNVHEKFDDAGALIDETTQRRLARVLDDFVGWARREAD